MLRLEDLAEHQVLYAKTSARRAMPWRGGVHSIRISKVILGPERGVVASWNNRAPRFFPEDAVKDWRIDKPSQAPR